jgi:hypothetical protein
MKETYYYKMISNSTYGTVNVTTNYIEYVDYDLIEKEFNSETYNKVLRSIWTNKKKLARDKKIHLS